MSTPSKWRLAPWAIAAGVLLAGLGGMYWYRSTSDRYQLRRFLRESMDQLHADLRALQPGAASRKDMTTAPDIPVSLSITICNDAERVANSLAVVPMSFAVDASEDPEEFKGWVARLQREHESRAADVHAEIQRIEQQFRADPHAFSNFMSGDSVGLTPAGELYFNKGDTGQGCLVEKAMHIDFMRWADGMLYMGNSFAQKQ
jgi:hypothetical protein